MIQLSGTFWPFVPAGLLVASLGGLVSMALIASDDPGFALERDYYRKAVGYDREIAQRAENARLAWDIELAEPALGQHGRAQIAARVRSGTEALSGAHVRVQAIYNASANRILDARLEPGAPGEYRAELPLERAGLWEFRFTVERGSERFTQSLRLDVREGSP
jgi:hypothetical protein